MDRVREILSFAARLLPINALIRVTGQKLVFPLYHAASDYNPPHLRHLYKIRSVSEFEKDIDAICRYFEPLSPEILSLPGNPRRLTKPGFILSFDDGLREIKEVVEPILSRKGINAIFFLNNAFIDNRGLFFRYKASMLADLILSSAENSLPLKEIAEYLGHVNYTKQSIKAELLKIRYENKYKLDYIAGIIGFDTERFLEESKPYLSGIDISDLQDKGFYIGSHSFDHPLFSSLTEDQMIKEAVASIEDIENKFSPPLNFFAFPFTDGGISSAVIDAIFKGRADAIFGSAGLKNEKHLNHFQRIPVEKSLQPALNYIKSEYLYYILKSGFGRNSIKR